MATFFNVCIVLVAEAVRFVDYWYANEAVGRCVIFDDHLSTAKCQLSINPQVLSGRYACPA